MASTNPASNPRQYIIWKILSICPNKLMSEELGRLVHNRMPYGSLADLNEYPARADIAESLQIHTPNLCFVDVATNLDWALSIVSDLSSLDPKLPIVALHGANDPDLILRCLRMGASEFLLQPITADQFDELVDRVAVRLRSARGAEATGKVVCVVPAKGACGASTVACSLAYQWKRLGAKRILLADLDPLTGTISFQLKLRQTYSFMDALTRSLDSDIWRGIVSTAQGVDVLLGPDRPVHGIDEGHDPGGIIEFARLNYDVVVVDTSGAYGQWSLTLARICDELLLVTTNELPALQATQRSLAYLERNGIDRSKVKIVVNRYYKEIGLTEDVIQTALDSEVYQTIPSDYETVQRALVEGKPLTVSTSVGKSLGALAEKLSDGDLVKGPKPSSGGLGGFFNSLLRR